MFVSCAGIRASTGELFNLKPLDRETTPSYSVRVNVSDGQSSASVPVTITVRDANDNSPEFTGASYEFSVLENQAAVVEVKFV